MKKINTELMVYSGFWFNNGLKNLGLSDTAKNVLNNLNNYKDDGFSEDFGVRFRDIEFIKEQKEMKRYGIILSPIQTYICDMQGTYKGEIHLCVDPFKLKIFSSYFTNLDGSITEERVIDDSINSIKKRLNHLNELLYKKVVKQENVTKFIVNGMKGLRKQHNGIFIGLSDPNLNEILNGLIAKEEPTDIYKEDRAAFERLYHFLGYDKGIKKDYIFEDRANGKKVKAIMTKSKPKKNLIVGRIVVDNNLSAELDNLMRDWMTKT